MKKEPVKSFNISDIYDGNNPKNEIYKQLAESFKKKVNSHSAKELSKLPGPKSYAVPYIHNAKIGM